MTNTLKCLTAMPRVPTRLGLLAAILLLGTASEAGAGVIFNFSDAQLGGGSRWDAAARNVVISGQTVERSLQGGLRYSLQGGSFQAYRDLFAWNVLPTVADFQTAVQQAFDAWSSVDPVSGVGSTLRFNADLATAVVGANTGNGGTSALGAEIDLFGSNDAFFWNPGNNGTQAETGFLTRNSTVTLTSGTANYAGSSAIIGADIIVNSNPGAIYTLDLFRRLLTHEIGHAIGLGDVEGDINPGAFIDDNYDGSSSATAKATLNNSWVDKVNILNPAASAGLSRYTVPYGNPGTQTPDVNILMESRGLGIATGNPVTKLVPLTNDDYGTRQFLYPIPEPSSLALCAAGLLGLATLTRRRSRAN